MAKTCCIKCTPIKPPVVCDEEPGWMGAVKTAAIVAALALAAFAAYSYLSGDGQVIILGLS